MMILNYNAPNHVKGDFFEIGNILVEYVEDILKTDIKIYSPTSISSDQIVIIRELDVSNSSDVKIYQCKIFVDKTIIPVTDSIELLSPEQCLVIYAKYHYKLIRKQDLFVINGRQENIIDNPELGELYTSMLDTYVNKLPITYLIRTNKFHIQMHCNTIVDQLTDNETSNIVEMLFGING